MKIQIECVRFGIYVIDFFRGCGLSQQWRNKQ